MRTAEEVEVRLAEPSDLPAIRKFWFNLYCLEMNRYGDRYAGACELRDVLDDRSHIATAFTRDSGEVVGTLMSTFLSGGDVGVYEEVYGLPASEHDRSRLSIATKMMVDSRFRRTDLATRLAQFSYWTGQQNGITRSFMDCNSHLISFFLRLGFRPHLGWRQHPDFGRVFTMVLHLDDPDYLEALGSAFLRAVPENEVQKQSA